MLHLHVWKDYLEKQETEFKKETEKYRCTMILSASKIFFPFEFFPS